jgi:hypothetical protein
VSCSCDRRLLSMHLEDESKTHVITEYLCVVNDLRGWGIWLGGTSSWRIPHVVARRLGILLATMEKLVGTMVTKVI